ncbi:GDSL-type esterase/lipase family protein [Paenibacillus fonticola]|uniref:GDSL-type esterase/lipase family protein n=1 Tax=Paenibacillus fonticola TaxID=379896 RepID=UPI00035D303F|nr:GDSL-type esterase/lipase family protein [Paenibacillus fonticola]
MSKNKMIIMLIGIITLLLAACGNQNGSRNIASLTLNEGDNPTASQQDSYKNLFQRSVFLGDSITEGLSYHDVLNEENVLAGAGKTAQFALEDVEELVKRKPEHIFIQLGSDDILWPTDNPKEYSLSYYAQLIDEIAGKLPDAAITLLSVTPVTAEAESSEPRYLNIGEYNEGVKELAAEKQVGFVDLSPIVADHTELYDTDGIHFQAEYYPILLDFLKDKLVHGINTK